MFAHGTRLSVQLVKAVCTTHQHHDEVTHHTPATTTAPGRWGARVSAGLCHTWAGQGRATDLPAGFQYHPPPLCNMMTQVCDHTNMNTSLLQLCGIHSNMHYHCRCHWQRHHLATTNQSQPLSAAAPTQATLAAHQPL